MFTLVLEIVSNLQQTLASPIFIRISIYRYISTQIAAVSYHIDFLEFSAAICSLCWYWTYMNLILMMPHGKKRKYQMILRIAFNASNFPIPNTGYIICLMIVLKYLHAVFTKWAFSRLLSISEKLLSCEIFLNKTAIEEITLQRADIGNN